MTLALCLMSHMPRPLHLEKEKVRTHANLREHVRTHTRRYKSAVRAERELPTNPVAPKIKASVQVSRSSVLLLQPRLRASRLNPKL